MERLKLAKNIPSLTALCALILQPKPIFTKHNATIKFLRFREFKCSN